MQAETKNQTKTQTECEPDFLENDTPIPGQNYVCLSFLSPESCIADKQLFLTYNFLKDSATTLFNKESENQVSFESFKGQYEEYCFREQERLQKQFHEDNDFTTSVRGLKVRGVYDNIVEAKYRAKQLQRKAPLFNVFVGQVGFWLPWDPSPGQISEQEYLNDQLNTLMKSYRENQEQKNMVWSQNKDNIMKKVANDANNANAQESKSELEEKISVMEESDPWMQQKGGPGQYK